MHGWSWMIKPVYAHLSSFQSFLIYLQCLQVKGTWSDTLEAVSSDTCELCPAGRFSVPCQAMLEGYWETFLPFLVSEEVEIWKFAWNHSVRMCQVRFIKTVWEGVVRLLACKSWFARCTVFIGFLAFYAMPSLPVIHDSVNQSRTILSNCLLFCNPGWSTNFSAWDYSI